MYLKFKLFNDLLKFIAVYILKYFIKFLKCLTNYTQTKIKEQST